MIGTVLKSGRDRISRITCVPSIPGRLISIKITSGQYEANRLKALGPSSTASTWKPAILKLANLSGGGSLCRLFFMKADTHPKYVEAEIRCACGNVIKTRSTKPVLLLGGCNVCHPFYTGTQKVVDTLVV